MIPRRPEEIIINKSAPPVLIYQMGKVGSISVYASLKNAGIPNSLFHVHQLSDEGLRKKEGWLRFNGIEKIPDDLRFFKQLRQVIDKNRTTCHWKIITMTREPIGLEISGIFQNMKIWYRQLLNTGNTPDKKKTLDYLHERFDKLDMSKNYYANWFDVELKAMFNIDVYSKPYDFERGFSIFTHENVSVLLIRLEDMNKSLNTAIQQFLGRDIDLDAASTNIGSRKTYSREYKKVLDILSLPRPICEKIYSTTYARHFYSTDDIARFTAKWSGGWSGIKRKTKAVCIIYGNCIGRILMNILRKNEAFTDIFDITYVRSFNHPTEGPPEIPADTVQKCSLLLLQRGHLQYPDFLDELPAGCRTITFPILSLRVLWPLMRKDPRNKPEPEKGYHFGLYPNGDHLVMKLLRKGLTPDQVFERYMSTNIFDLVDIEQLRETHLQDGKELDAKCDLPLCRYVGENFSRERLFWTPTHPTHSLVIKQVNQILEALHMNALPDEVVTEINKHPPGENFHLPVHPQLIEYFDIKWADKNTKYRHFDKGWFSFEEYLKRYIELS